MPLAAPVTSAVFPAKEPGPVDALRACGAAALAQASSAAATIIVQAVRDERALDRQQEIFKDPLRWVQEPYPATGGAATAG